MNIKTIGIIGAGIMGSGIGQVMALAGFEVVLMDVRDEFLDKGLGNIKKGLDKMIERGKITPGEKKNIIARVHKTTRIVEIIKGQNTADETLLIVKNLAEKLGKINVESKDSPGFIVNRVLMPLINEAVFAFMEGVASAEDIDKAMTLGTNQPIGPLALADLIGLDTVLSIMESIYKETRDPRHSPCPLLKKYVDAGNLGRKTGKGFYNYQ